MSKKRHNDFFYQFHARFGHSSARNFHLKISMTGIKYYFFIKKKEKNVSINYIKHITKKLTSEFKYHNLREGEVILNELSKNTLFTHST